MGSVCASCLACWSIERSWARIWAGHYPIARATPLARYKFDVDGVRMCMGSVSVVIGISN